MASGHGRRPLPRKLVAVPCVCSADPAACGTHALPSLLRTPSTRTGCAYGTAGEVRHPRPNSRAGLRYSDGPYDLERYKRLHEIASELLDAEEREFRWPVEIGYATPKVDVRAAVIQDGKILLVREASSGQWTLPGGWADLNASPTENAAREVLEEAGIVVTVRKLIACWDKDRQGHPRQPEHVYMLVFLC